MIQSVRKWSNEAIQRDLFTGHGLHTGVCTVLWVWVEVEFEVLFQRLFLLD